MVELAGSFRYFKPTKVLLVGDIMLDTYTKGSINRVSPEAPVPVLKVESSEEKVGGAGNVMLNLQALGAEVLPLTRIGDDKAGKVLLKLLQSQGLSIEGIAIDPNFQTPVKDRIIASNQQLMRLDHENTNPLSKETAKKLWEQALNWLPDVDIIAISDYSKGLLSHEFLQKLIYACRQQDKKVIVDPKGRDFSKYKGAYLIKPNMKEALLASGLDQEASLEAIAATLHTLMDYEYLMITRSKEGITFFDKRNQRFDRPVTVKEVNDVTGAGDTVLSMLCFALSNNIPIEKAASLANMAAGIAIEHFGCVAVGLSELAQRMLELDERNKVFELGHLYALKAALDKVPFALITLKASQDIPLSLFSQLQELCQEQKLVIYLQGEQNEDFIDMLVSLKEVDFIILPSGDKGLKEVRQELEVNTLWEFSQGKIKAVDKALDLHF